MATPTLAPANKRSKNIIVMEFNELCPALLERWIDEGRLPNFARLQSESDVFVTDADVRDPGQLEPWIQWYSTHTGLAYDQHHVFHLTEGARADHDDVYRTLMRAGHRVACFAGMNARSFAAPGSLFVGDPWSENENAYPAELETYNRFVSRNVREYSNASNRLNARDYARFLSFMLAHGLRVSTIHKLASQLVQERIGDRRLSYRRAALLDRLQFDVFRWYYDRNKPSFATFFINSTAHLQHSYWRHFEPEVFAVKPSAEELSVYGDAIRFGYEAMDKLVGDFLDLARRSDARLMFMTALSQQPFLKHESKGGQKFYRLYDVERFFHDWDIAYAEVSPTMTNQYLVHFQDPAHAQDARNRLAAFVMENGQVVFDMRDAASDGLYFGCGLHGSVAADAPVTHAPTGRQVRFGDMLYMLDAMKSGCHHPEGALWIGGGNGCKHRNHVSILDVFPTVLELLDVPAPEGDGRRGVSVVPELADGPFLAPRDNARRPVAA